MSKGLAMNFSMKYPLEIYYPIIGMTDDCDFINIYNFPASSLTP